MLSVLISISTVFFFFPFFCIITKTSDKVLVCGWLVCVWILCCLSLLSTIMKDNLKLISLTFAALTSSCFSLLPFHCTAALWWPSRAAVRSISCGSSWPIHPVVHNAPGPSEARPACKTSLPRRHCHSSSLRPAEQGWHRWATSDSTPAFNSNLFLSNLDLCGGVLAAGLHFTLSFLSFYI